MRIIVNGCFDCFHDGHKHIINHAMKFVGGGEVYVLINSDESVKNLKGVSRPIDKYQKRFKNVIEYWQSIHPHRLPQMWIDSFNTENDLLKIINEFEPDMIIKGNDRPDVREIVGSDKWPVCIIPRLKDKDGNDISTTGGILK